MNEIEAAFADELMPSVERGATQLVLMHMPLVRLKTMWRSIRFEITIKAQPSQSS